MAKECDLMEGITVFVEGIGRVICIALLIRVLNNFADRLGCAFVGGADGNQSDIPLKASAGAQA